MSLRQAKCKSWRVGLKFKLAYPLKKVERCGINNVVSVKPVGLDEPARVGDFNRDRTSQRTGQIGFCARILGDCLALCCRAWHEAFSPAQLASGSLCAFGDRLFLLLLTTRVMGAMTASALRWAGLGLVDRLAGFALGLARAMLILALCALLAQRLGLMQHESFDRAHSRGLWIWLVQTAEPYWSDMVQAKLRGET